MKNYLSNLDRKHLSMIRDIGKAASCRKLSAYVVGGIVRDIILKKKNFDLDIVVEGDAICFAKLLAKKWKAQLTTYKKFGTACLEAPAGLRIDLATARKESYACSGALPDVQPGSLKDDLFRRDFSINAMAIAINPDCFGQLIDEFGGLKDLSKRKIRVLYDQSFIDDPTRIFRAIRFEQRFHFKLHRKTLLLMKTALQKNIIANVKPPRHFAEFKKILSEADPLKCLRRLHQLEGFRFLDSKLEIHFRDLNLMHKRIEKIRRKRLYEHGNCWWLVYFMGVIAKASDVSAKNILKKFPFTKNERIAIQQSQKAGDIIKNLSVKNLRPSQVYQILKSLAMEVICYLRIRTSRVSIGRRIDRFLAEDANVKLQINGKDLKRAGVTSGSEMGRVLEHVLYLKIDKRVSTKQEEYNAALLSLGRY